MSKGLKAVRGMNDIVPSDSARWRDLESTITATLSEYGYGEIRLPIVEQTAVFHRSIGDATDIVQKEMYTFEDRNGDSLSLRPEGTASCVRAVLEHNLLQQVPRRMWYQGPMFRHERPQRGRQRQFHQIGVEAFGAAGPDIDSELILLGARLWNRLGLSNLRLEINSLGEVEARSAYRHALVDYFRSHEGALDDDSMRRLDTNPLRILDSKNPAMADLITAAPSLGDYLDDSSADHFEAVKDTLRAASVEFSVNPRLVRGLDYYSKTVFEWVTDELGAQGTVCAGGRYDGLIELMGGKPTPAIGMAMGLERLLELRDIQRSQSAATACDVYVLATDGELEAYALELSESIRDKNSGWRVVLHVGGGSMKSRLKKADRSGAELALIVGQEEVLNGTVSIKPLRSTDPQTAVARDALADELKSRLST